MDVGSKKRSSDKNELPTEAKSALHSTRLVSVDDIIDDLSRQALKQARDVEEQERHHRHPDPLFRANRTTDRTKPKTVSADVVQSDAQPPIKMPDPPDDKQPEIPKVGSRDAPGG
jgi:hypothetical protein